MEDVKNDMSSQPIVIEKQEGLLNALFSFFMFMAIVLTFFWNFDGFWQTNIKQINDAQRAYFPVKYKQEQLKLSRINYNNQLIDDIQKRLDRSELRSEEKIKKAHADRDNAINVASQYKESLESYLAEENNKCRYYKTSLMMIKHLTRKYSEDELRNVINCTNTECEEIIRFKPEAYYVCN